MKKILLTVACFSLMVFTVNAQKWVKTTPTNKNVILEEFTGIHCGYCPDGHKIANGIVEANPNRVFLINIHAGSFATPSAGEPDFRTTEGNAIDAAAKVTGYPSGSINRSTSPWGMSRSAWAGKAGTILAESSPLNVYVKSFVDFSTREITTEVEVYYTSDAATTKNYLTIALTQDDILGPQSDYGNYNPTNWVDGKYRHNHVLRQLITSGNFGEEIATTTTGSYVYKTYKTTIPDNYKGVDAILHKMHVVAFVSANSDGSGIISGADAPVDFDPNLKTDLALNDLTVKPANFCFTTINPKIEVTNNLDQPVTSFDVIADLNGAQFTKSFSGNLNKGEKTTIDWGDLPFSPTGAYTVKIIGFKNVNGGNLYDVNETNDATSFSNFGFKSNAFSTFVTDFESGLPANMALDVSLNPKLTLIKGTTVKYGNFGSASAMLFYLHSSWNIAGKPAHILLGESDLSGLTDPGLGYYYAYSDAGYGGTAPTIVTSVSSDCGKTWQQVGTVTAQETGLPTTSGNLYDPKNGEYKYVITSLKDYAGKSVLVKITGTPGSTGNALYIDNININSAQRLSAPKEMVSKPHLVLSPNPVKDFGTVSYELVKPSDIIFTIYNVLNQVVFTKTISSQSSGTHEESIDMSGFESGVYTLSVNTNDAVSTKKFIKK
ncbi:MAG: Omp28-related outer membrane protein [Flavobacteriales bacterium]|nr:Omp28-related outer membrane protein [Flavobacteriales bacterium]